MRPRKPIVIYKSWDELPLLIDVAALSILTGLGNQRIRQLCKSGELPAFQVGKKWLVEKEDFIAWKDKRKTVNIGA
ncbi:helix-turn-helix domain-containing protein [Anaerotignum sp.]